MYFEEKRRVLLISPQPWSEMHVSKHHYAIELAAGGHDVFFAGPSRFGGPADLTIRPKDTGFGEIKLVQWRATRLYRAKFHCRLLFDWAMRAQARRISSALGPLDLVWDFDNSYNFMDLNAFRAPATIAHFVDTPGRLAAPNDKKADLVVCVGRPYADMIQREDIAVLPHGLGRAFDEVTQLRSDEQGSSGKTPTAVFIGNLNSSAFDAELLERLVEEFPDTHFLMIGSVSFDPSARCGAKLAQLKGRSNIEFTGPLDKASLIERCLSADVLLTLYTQQETIDGAVASHKSLEYLALGLAHVSTPALATSPGDEYTHFSPSSEHSDYIATFRNALENISVLNAGDMMAKRRQTASQNTYKRRLAEIGEQLSERINVH